MPRKSGSNRKKAMDKPANAALYGNLNYFRQLPADDSRLNQPAQQATRLYKEGESPLSIAARTNNQELVKVLLEKGADLNQALAFARFESITVIGLACGTSNIPIEMLIFLLKYNPELNTLIKIKDNPQRTTPLAAAISKVSPENDSLQKCHLLLQQENLNLNFHYPNNKDNLSATALTCVIDRRDQLKKAGHTNKKVYHDLYQLASLMLEKGANVYVKSTCSALLRSLYFRDYEIFMLCLKNNPDELFIKRSHKVHGNLVDTSALDFVFLTKNLHLIKLVFEVEGIDIKKTLPGQIETNGGVEKIEHTLLMYLHPFFSEYDSDFIAIVDYMLEKGADLLFYQTLPSAKKITAFYIQAIETEDLNLTRYILEKIQQHPVEIEKKWMFTRCLITIINSCKNKKQLEILAEYVDLNNMTTFEDFEKRRISSITTATILCVELGCDLSLFETLKELGVDLHKPITLTNQQEITPLYQAMALDHVEIAEYLISQGSDIYQQNKLSWPVLTFAIQFNKILFLKMLKDLKINWERLLDEKLVQTISSKVIQDEDEIIKLLLDSGLDPATLFSISSLPALTLLQIAIFGQASRTCLTILDVIEPPISINDFHHAIQSGMPEVVNKMLYLGSTANQQIKSDDSLAVDGWHIAIKVFTENPDVLFALLENSFDLNQITKAKLNQAQSLKKLLECGHPGVIQLLKNHGVGSNKAAPFQSSALTQRSAQTFFSHNTTAEREKHSDFSLNIAQLIHANDNASYWLVHAKVQLNAIQKSLDKVGRGYPVISNYNIQYHSFRMLESLANYCKLIPQAQISKKNRQTINQLRNLIMHQHEQLAHTNLSLLLDEFIPIMSKTLDSLTQQKNNKILLITTRAKQRKKLSLKDNKAWRKMNQWVENYLNEYKKTFCESNELAILELSFSYLNNKTDVPFSKKVMVAMTMSLVKLGEHYQQKQQNNTDFVKHCRKIRNKVGHEILELEDSTKDSFAEVDPYWIYDIVKEKLGRIAAEEIPAALPSP